MHNSIYASRINPQKAFAFKSSDKGSHLFFVLILEISSIDYNIRPYSPCCLDSYLSRYGHRASTCSTDKPSKSAGRFFKSLYRVFSILIHVSERVVQYKSVLVPPLRLA